MEIRGKKFVVLYLEGWQMRMIKDFLGIECDHWTVPIESGPVMRYMAPAVAAQDLDPRAKRMYLTEWQMREIRDATGETCQFIELRPEVVTKYGGPVRTELEKLASTV